jgi:hypothetical protein
MISAVIMVTKNWLNHKAFYIIANPNQYHSYMFKIFTGLPCESDGMI